MMGRIFFLARERRGAGGVGNQASSREELFKARGEIDVQLAEPCGDLAALQVPVVLPNRLARGLAPLLLGDNSRGLTPELRRYRRRLAELREAPLQVGLCRQKAHGRDDGFERIV